MFRLAEKAFGRFMILCVLANCLALFSFVPAIETKADGESGRVEKITSGLTPRTARKIRAAATPTPEIPETRRYDMKSCIQTFSERRFVIKDREGFLKAIRSDGSLGWCIENLGKIDFAKHTLLGVAFRSGYCRIPAGLRVETIKDAAKKQYLFAVSYLGPQGVCRHLGGYAVWVLAPKLPDDYEVVFEVKARLGKSR